MDKALLSKSCRLEQANYGGSSPPWVGLQATGRKLAGLPPPTGPEGPVGARFLAQAKGAFLWRES